MNDKTVGPVHWSFWAIGTIGLIWNVLGCLNFFSQMNAEAVAGMPESYRAIIESRPAWATGAFAIAVFGGTLGSVLLLLRKRAAYYLFVASLVGALGAQLPLLGMADFPVAALVGGLMQLAVTAFLIWYSKQVEGKGWIPREQ